MAEVEGIVKAFVTQYYQTFDTNRSALAQLYTPESQLTFEGQLFRGPEAIAEKLKSMPFQVVQHIITTTDHQLTGADSLLICVMGQLKTDNDPPHSFAQTFLLKQVGNSLMVVNDLFRLILHSIAT